MANPIHARNAMTMLGMNPILSFPLRSQNEVIETNNGTETIMEINTAPHIAKIPSCHNPLKLSTNT